MVEELKVRTYNPEKQTVANLSGGNQQKVVLSKWVNRRPKVFLLDEPTRGVDVGAKYEIYGIINGLAKEKSAVLMVSSEMDELMGMCDRILVMYNNRITADFHRGRYSQENIMLAAIGGMPDE
jgi:ribose transport system ATP-binding protein